MEKFTPEGTERQRIRIHEDEITLYPATNEEPITSKICGSFVETVTGSKAIEVWIT